LAVLALVLGRGGVGPSSLRVTLAGSAGEASASGVSCASRGAGVEVAGTLSARVPDPHGMTVYASVHPAAGGVSVGESAVMSIAPGQVGQPKKFRGVISGTGKPAGDRCVVLWVANPAPT